MTLGPAEQQSIILAISNGNDVLVEHLRWAIENQYVAIVNGDEVEVTQAGWALLQGR